MQQKPLATRPLQGIRVIDFGQFIAGPMVAMMLADQGAEVIRVDPPGGPRWDHPVNAVLNRGKRSIMLDLKTPADREVAQKLVGSADIVVENFRPGVMSRLGLGTAAMTETNRGLVYLSLPGFSSNDADRAHLPAWEGIVAAEMGQFTDMGLNRVLMGINPSFSPLPLASTYAAVLGALAAMLALFKRLESGYGDVIEVPLASALLEGLAYNSMRVQDYPERYKALREREIERRRAAGETMDVTYAALQELLDPFYRNYACADGRNFYVVCGSHAAHPVNALKLLGLWEEMSNTGLPVFDAYLSTSDWPDGADCTLPSYPLSQPWADRISARMKQAFRSRGAFEWERIWGEAGVPAAAQQTTEEWLSSDHARSSALIIELDDPIYGRMRQPGNIAWLAGDGDHPLRNPPAPALDADREAVLESSRNTPAAVPISKPKHQEAWLQGIRILDLTNVIAGPSIAGVLARFGAEVISIDPVKPTLDPWNTIVFGLQANRGKKSLLANLKTDEGRDILARLLRQVDIVTVNALDRQLEPLGLSPARLKADFPNLVLCQLDAYGGPRRGSRSDHPGYDDLIQASTGVMARFGGGLDTPEEHAHFGTIDVLGGFSAAFACAVALVKRSRGGGGDVARSSLAAAGQMLQLPFMYDYDGRAAFDEPSGRNVKGARALYRCYEAADGWFFLAAPRHRRGELESIPELGAVGTVPEVELEAFLSDRFRTRPLAYWTTELESRDFGARPMNTLASVRENNLFRESDGQFDIFGPTAAFIRHDQTVADYRYQHLDRLQRLGRFKPLRGAGRAGRQLVFAHPLHRAPMGERVCQPTAERSSRSAPGNTVADIIRPIPAHGVGLCQWLLEEIRFCRLGELRKIVCPLGRGRRLPSRLRHPARPALPARFAQSLPLCGHRGS